MRYACPHCGNTDTRLMQDNGLRANHPDFTLLCVKRVPPDESSFERVLITPEDINADGLTACGMQWEPNNESPY